MSNIKDPLTRKFGPLPAWAWAIIGGIGLYWYRNRTGAAASTADQSQAAASEGYYGPYGQDAYPITGGSGNGGAGTDTGTTTGDNSGPPTIVVNNGPGGKRQRKHKQQHNKKQHKNGNGRKRSDAHVHNGAHHRVSAGKSRSMATRQARTKVTPLKGKPTSTNHPQSNPSKQFHGGPARLHKKGK